MTHNDDLINDESLAPLDEFEQCWVDALCLHDAELQRTEDAFVQAVLERHHASADQPEQSPEQAPVIAGRIGVGLLPYAAAAVVLLAVMVGYFVFKPAPTTAPAPDKIVEVVPAPQENTNTPQPAPGPAVAHVDPSKLRLGEMIARAKTLPQPVTGFPQTVRDTPQALNVKNLLELIENPVPDLKELLAPLKPAEQQSQA